jgi:arabinofuranosyltransferase
MLLAPVVVLVVLGWTHRWVDEDAFLNFRIVDQIRAGHGPVFNVGQRVEVATSPLWLAMLTVARSVLPFVKIEYLSIFGGLLLTGLGLWLAEVGARRLWRPASSSLSIPLGAVVFAALPASWEWATSGLENGLSLAWIGALMLVLATFARRDPPATTAGRTVAVGLLLGLGLLVRPDLAIMSVAAIAAVVWMRRPRGAALAQLLVGFAALPVLSEIFRAGYYGTLVPNTALAKDAGGTYWSQGWNYFFDLVMPYWLWLPVGAVAVVAVLLLLRSGANGPSPVVVFALPVAGALHALFIVKSGGDYLHARLLLPSLFALLAPFSAVPWSRRLVAPLGAVGVWAVLALAVLRPAVHNTVGPLTQYNVVEARGLMSEFARPGERPVLATSFVDRDGALAKRLQGAGKHALVTVTSKKPLLDATPKRTTLVTTLSGISGYLAGPDVLVHEANSLGDPVGSRMPPTRSNSAGHRKREDFPWIFALTTKPGVTGGFDAAQIDAARHALRCGALAEVVAATEEPMSVDRFWSNLTGSIGRTRLVVPRDPFVAERTFCGTKGRNAG